MTRILFVCPYPQDVAPSQRLKFEQYYNIFRQNDIQIETTSFINNKFWKIVYKKGHFWSKFFFTLFAYGRRFQYLFKLPGYDIVYIHLWVTPFGPSFFEWLYRRFSKKIIYDIDDLIYLKNIKSRSNLFISLIKGRRKPIYLMKVADHVISCTPYLDDFVRKYNLNTTDISSTINTDLYTPKTSYDFYEKPIIGWSGSHSTSKYLYLLRPVFQKLARTNIFRLVVMGDKDFSIDGVEVEAFEWDSIHEIEIIKKFSIGVYPLPDEEWVLGKSGLKAIQYMALGVPTIATAIGANFRVIEDNVSGFLVKDDDEWLNRLKELLRDIELQKNIGQNGRRRVENLFSVRANTSKYLEVFSHALAEPKPK